MADPMLESVDAAMKAAMEHYRLGRLPAAELLYRQVLQRQPDNSTAVQMLGLIAHTAGRSQEAIELLGRAVALRPSSASFRNNLASALATAGRLDEAIGTFHEAIRLDRQRPEPYAGLGMALRDMDRFDESVTVLRQALRIQSLCPDAHNALGTVLVQLGNMDAAIAAFRAAISVRPDYVDAHVNHAMALLTIGDFQAGWREYEWRCRQANPLWARHWTKPRWAGQDCSGRTILLYAEGGLGNVIQFARFALLLRERGAQVVVECQPSLKLLLRTMEPAVTVIGQGEPLLRHDFQAPLVSVAGILGVTVSTVPAKSPYLHPSNSLVENWRREISRFPGFKVGIAWQGNPAYTDDRRRSIPLKHFAVLGQIPGVRLYRLQKVRGMEQISQTGADAWTMDLGAKLDENTGPFMDTAAAMKNLDLIVTSDTSIAHLAGALGVPVWTTLCFAPDWRWMLGREDSPWYPTMRLFRQQRPGHWDEVFARIADALRMQSPRAQAAQ